MQRKLLYKILGIVAGIVFVGAGFQQNHHVSRLKRFGTQATVIRPDSYIDHSKNGSHTYTADISFKTAEGSLISGKHSMPAEALEAMKAEKPVTVYYDARDPTDFVFESEGSDYLLPAVGAGVIVAALFLL